MTASVVAILPARFISPVIAGGAYINALAGKPLPGAEVLERSAERA